MVAHPTAEVQEWPIDVIPVIDLMSGQVVRARAGQREHYAPIQSPLVQGSDPTSILEALLQRCHAKKAYIADLDAIMKDQIQSTCIESLANYFKDTELWLDAGFTQFAEAHQAVRRHGENLIPVLGTETLIGLEDLSQHHQHCVLSLDFGPDGFRGDIGWLSCPQYWPDQVIVMTLDRVGIQEGPDYKELKTALVQSQKRLPATRIFAAGGVTQSDALKLKELGVAGALVATALHTMK